MAGENGNKISDYKLAAIQADYESGIGTRVSIAKKHRMSRQTLIRNAKRLGWKWGESYTNVTDKITEKVTERIVSDESNKLIDFTTTHLKHIKDLGILSGINKADLAKVAILTKSFTEADKGKVWNMINIQKFIESSVKTFDMIFKSQRLAMGLDKDKPEGDGNVDSLIVKRMTKLKT